MSEGFGKSFIESLERLIDKPPYLFFTFIAAALVLVSVASDRYFDQIWMFFLYSVGGMVWRHAEKDVRNNILRLDRFKTVSLVVYQIVNLIAFTLFFVYFFKLVLA